MDRGTWWATVLGVAKSWTQLKQLSRHARTLKPLKLFGFPWELRGKGSACNAGDMGSIPGSEKSPGGGNGNLLQYSCLENPMDRGTWWATVLRVAKSQTGLND